MRPTTADSLGHEEVSYFQNWSSSYSDSDTESSKTNGANVRDPLGEEVSADSSLLYSLLTSKAISECCNSEKKGELNKTKSERRRTTPKKLHFVPDYVNVLLDSAGTLRFQCKVCMKAFKTKAHIKYHFFCNSTTSQKPYKCQTCGQSFIAKAHYAYHVRTHTGKRRLFHCDICYSDFTRKDNLMRHIEHIHDQSKDIARELAKQSSGIDGVKQYQKLMKTPGNTAVLSSGNKPTIPTLTTYTELPNETDTMKERLAADAATTTTEHAAKLINATTTPTSRQLSVIFDSKYNIVQVGYSQNQNRTQSKCSISLGNDNDGNMIKATKTRNTLGNYSQESMMESTESSLQEGGVAVYSGVETITYKLGSEEIKFWEVFQALNAWEERNDGTDGQLLF